MVWAGSGAVTVEARVGNVQELIPEIASLRPWTMTWSNVSDYYKTREFHSIARACSVNGDTLHFAYSMNWSTNVVGSHIIDYNDAEQRKEIFDLGYKAMDSLYEGLNFKSVFRCPPPENPMNIADMSLCLSLHRKWIDHFFEVARGDGPCQVGNIEPAIFNPLTNTGSNTLLFTFTYDPEIVLNPQQEEKSAEQFVNSISFMSVDQLMDAISWLEDEEESGETLSSAAGRMYHERIPSMVKDMKKQLESLQESTTTRRP